MISVIADKRGQRAYPDPDPMPATHLTLAVALTRDFGTDAHCQSVCVPGAPFRLKKAAIPKLTGGVPITAFLVDVDGPDHAADDAWFRGERTKIEALFASHPGGFCYRTRGGYRLCYELSGHVIRDDDDGHRWRLYYHRCLLHLARDFGIVADPACSDWTRLFRLPHATRDKSHGPEQLETIGEPQAIGAWTYTPGSVAQDIATVRELHASFLASNPDTKTSPWAPVLKRLDPPPAPATMGPASFVGTESKRARVALEREAADLAACPKGGRNPACNTASLKLGHYVASGELDETTIKNTLLDAMTANGSVRDYGADACRGTIASGINEGKKTMPSTPLHATTTDDAQPPEWLDDGPDEEPPPRNRPRPRRDFNSTDMGNAERLVARYADRIRYCPPKRRWLAWDGARWRWDETGVLNRLAKRTVRSIYDEAGAADDEATRVSLAKHATKSEAADRLAAMVRLASTEDGIAVMPDQLDADPWILNCRNGTLDLRTGKLGPHDRAHLCTKLAPVDYEPEARHPVWEAFLSDVTGDDPELEAFLSRVAGWALAGVCDEKRFVFVFGEPDTGKSTFLDALATTIGDYHVGTDFSTWCTQTTTGGNRGDLVRLAGARLVTSVEVRAGARFDEALVKRVTGGDPITAAAKYESEVTFRPTFTLLLAANDAPKLRDDDAGAWARVLRVPFPHAIPAGKKNPNVRRALTDPNQAGPAILAWAVRGCLEWQRQGLRTCAAVEASTRAYRADMDRFDGFVADHCELHPHLRVSRRAFREAYLQWCREHQIRIPLTAMEVANRLKDMGVAGSKSNGERVWLGVTLADEASQDRGTQGHAGTPVSESPLREKTLSPLGSGDPC
jgi:putative DNA primase/helicase